jgi:hypothetical protein
LEYINPHRIASFSLIILGYHNQGIKVLFGPIFSTLNYNMLFFTSYLVHFDLRME